MKSRDQETQPLPVEQEIPPTKEQHEQPEVSLEGLSQEATQQVGDFMKQASKEVQKLSEQAKIATISPEEIQVFEQGMNEILSQMQDLLKDYQAELAKIKEADAESATQQQVLAELQSLLGDVDLGDAEIDSQELDDSSGRKDQLQRDIAGLGQAVEAVKANLEAGQDIGLKSQVKEQEQKREKIMMSDALKVVDKERVVKELLSDQVQSRAKDLLSSDEIVSREMADEIQELREERNKLNELAKKSFSPSEEIQELDGKISQAESLLNKLPAERRPQLAITTLEKLKQNRKEQWQKEMKVHIDAKSKQIINDLTGRAEAIVAKYEQKKLIDTAVENGEITPEAMVDIFANQIQEGKFDLGLVALIPSEIFSKALDKIPDERILELSNTTKLVYRQEGLKRVKEAVQNITQSSFPEMQTEYDSLIKELKALHRTHPEQTDEAQSQEIQSEELLKKLNNIERKMFNSLELLAKIGVVSYSDLSQDKAVTYLRGNEVGIDKMYLNMFVTKMDKKFQDNKDILTKYKQIDTDLARFSGMREKMEEEVKQREIQKEKASEECRNNIVEILQDKKDIDSLTTAITKAKNRLRQFEENSPSLGLYVSSEDRFRVGELKKLILDDSLEPKEEWKKILTDMDSLITRGGSRSSLCYV